MSDPSIPSTVIIVVSWFKSSGTCTSFPGRHESPSFVYPFVLMQQSLWNISRHRSNGCECLNLREEDFNSCTELPTLRVCFIYIGWHASMFRNSPRDVYDTHPWPYDTLDLPSYQCVSHLQVITVSLGLNSTVVLSFVPIEYCHPLVFVLGLKIPATHCM